MRGVRILTKYDIKNIFFRRIKSYTNRAEVQQKIIVYECDEETQHTPVLYHKLDERQYDAETDSIKIDEKIIDDLMDIGITNIAYYEEEFRETLFTDVATFINEGRVLKGKVYLPLDHFDSHPEWSMPYIPYIPRFRTPRPKIKNYDE